MSHNDEPASAGLLCAMHASLNCELLWCHVYCMQCNADLYVKRIRGGKWGRCCGLVIGGQKSHDFNRY